MARTTQAADERKINFLIVTIREDENRAVLTRFPERRFLPAQNRTYAVAEFQNRTGQVYKAAIVRTPEQGQNAANDTTRDAIEDLDPECILVVGIAGAIPDREFCLGDVIIGTRLHDFTVGAFVEHGPEFSNQGGRMKKDVQDLIALIPALDRDLLGWQEAATLSTRRPEVVISDNNFYGSAEWKKSTRDAMEFHFGKGGSNRAYPIATTRAIASSGFLIKNTSVIEQWQRSSRDVVAVEMELAGVYSAAQRRAKEYPVIAIRGISDIVGFKREPEWTPYACETAASFCASLLRNIPVRFFGDRALESIHSSHQQKTARSHTDLVQQPENKIGHHGVNVHSSMEQLWTNMSEKSSEGLSPAMDQAFMWGNLLDHGNGSSPHNLEALWGIDRGCFVGFLEGGRAEKAYQSVVQTENRLLASLRKSINGPAVSTRRWIRLNAGNYVSGWQGVSDWLANHLDRPSQEIPAKASIGLFLDIPLTSNLFIHGHNLNQWIQSVQQIAGSQLSFIFHWETAPLQLRSLLAEMRPLNPSLPIDHLRLDDPDNSQCNGSANRSVEALLKKNVAGKRGTLSDFPSHEANSVLAYAEAKISEERFIREQGMRAFSAALRAGCHFPEAITFASQIPITATDYWWLVRRLEPTRERVQAILNTDTARRAIWGLCSTCEWDSLPVHVKEQINEARENRKLVFSVSSMEKPTC